MIPLEEARAYVLGCVDRLAPAPMPLERLGGLVLAEPIVAGEQIPPFDNSAMDGFAVRSVDVADAPVELTIVGTVAAGRSGDRALGPGEAYRIMTGAPIPDGADAVVMVEWCEVEGGLVRVARPVPAGNHIRVAGDDIAAGEEVLAASTFVTPAVLGVLCTLGVQVATAVPRPVVGVVSTGDELVAPTETPGPGQIRDSNRAMLLALVEAAGAEAVDLGLVVDDDAAIEVALRGAVERCDAVISSGGVSMGDFDYVKVVLDRIGDMRWMQVAIKPAKPLAAGTIDHRGRRIPVLGLPGNPVSSLVSFQLFARPAIEALAGRPPVGPRRVQATAGEAFARRADGKVHVVRAVAETGDDGRLVVRSAGGQGSHHLAAAARADCLVVLGDGVGASAGDPVTVMLLD